MSTDAIAADAAQDPLFAFAERGMRAQNAAAQQIATAVLGVAENRDAVMAGVALALRAVGENTLANELEFGCLKLAQGEPFFVLRAQDASAGGLVRMWANQNAMSAPEAKIEAANAIADAMDRFPTKKSAD